MWFACGLCLVDQSSARPRFRPLFKFTGEETAFRKACNSASHQLTGHLPIAWKIACGFLASRPRTTLKPAHAQNASYLATEGVTMRGNCVYWCGQRRPAEGHRSLKSNNLKYLLHPVMLSSQTTATLVTIIVCARCLRCALQPTL